MQKKDKIVHFRVSKSIYRQVKNLAKSKGYRFLSTFIRRLISKELDMLWSE